MEHLGHSDAEQVIQVTPPGAPAAVLVTPEAVEEHIPGIIRSVMTNVAMSPVRMIGKWQLHLMGERSTVFTLPICSFACTSENLSHSLNPFNFSK